MFTSFEYLNKALSIDENGATMEDKTKAVYYYEKGLDELLIKLFF